jgi:Tol biopolymer transport system component
LLIAILFSPVALAQDAVFGKNKVQYKDFQWSYIQSEHFDVYYSQNGYELASFTAQVAEGAYVSIKKLLRFDINARIAIVVYNSHNEFQQTNVLDEYMVEGIGGVTEMFKNRIVVPFEGDYAQFRHVIHHELIHGVMNDMYYGGTIQSLLSSRTPLVLPLWFAEGMAEYGSLGWDTNSDMFLRDASINNYLPPIDYLSGYFAYRGGQAVFYYIARKYGEQKVTEILNRIKGTRSVDAGFKSAIGLTVKELSERWEKEMKKMYYPDVAKREEPEDFSRKLTDHSKLQNFYNSSPAISPQGDKIAFLSDRDDYFDVFLMSASDGTIIKKVVDGQRTKQFEELHLLTPGITWSPDGKKIALAVKSGAEDAIMVVDVESGDYERLTFGLDGISSVDWSHDGNQLVFVGTTMGQSDIYRYEFSSQTTLNLTNDLFSDFDPVFSPDGKTVYFSSDRKEYVTGVPLPKNFRISDFNFATRDLYAVDLTSLNIKRLTSNPKSNQVSPVVSGDGKKLLYLSDCNGINNIYEYDLASGVSRPLTNSLCGIYQLSLSNDGSKLVFSSLTKAGFDIFLLRAPFDRNLKVAELEPTDFVKRQLSATAQNSKHDEVEKGDALPGAIVAQKDNIIIASDTTSVHGVYDGASASAYTNYEFSDRAFRDTVGFRRFPGDAFNVSNNIDADGNYVEHKYKLNFTPDLIYGAAGYSTFYGVEGSTIMAFSDMLGDHRIIFQTNLMIDLKNSDYGMTYLYLPNRIDYGFTAFHSARFLYVSQYGYSYLNRFTTWVVGASASYPMDRFNRIDMNALYLNLSRENIDDPTLPSQTRAFVLPMLSYVHDNSLWTAGWFAPNNGSRFALNLMGSTRYSNESLEFLSMTMDYRSYNKIARDLIFVYRVTGGLSDGKDRQSFFIGGTEGWINRRFSNDQIPIEDVEDYAFLSPVLPLRGYDYNVQHGTRFGLVNVEMRFPLVKYLIFGAVPIGFRDILGAGFIDMGSAWSNEKQWQAFERDASNELVTRDLLFGTGFGMRVIFLGLPFRIDVAWQYNVKGFSEPVWYFSLGPEF